MTPKDASKRVRPSPHSEAPTEKDIKAYVATLVTHREALLEGLVKSATLESTRLSYKEEADLILHALGWVRRVSEDAHKI